MVVHCVWRELSYRNKELSDLLKSTKRIRNDAALTD